MINERIQYMKDHALIGKFIGIWPIEKALTRWINVTWKPKGRVDLHLWFKGFFTMVFNNLKDRERVFEDGPYFYNSTRLYLPYFNPDREDLVIALVWICIYSLSHE